MRLLPLLLTGGLLLGPALGGCSGPAEPEPLDVVDHGDARPSTPASTPATDPEPSPSPVVPPDFNPCDGIGSASVARALGSRLIKDVGDPDNLRCGLLPATEAGAVITVTYQPYDGTLDQLVADLGEDPDTVAQPDLGVDDADARLIYALDEPDEPAEPDGPDQGTSVFLTGFVQVGGLVEVVNAADPAPYDYPRLLRATTTVMRQLAAAAPRP